MKINISNIEPRRDTNGNILEAFEGTLLQAGDRFYFYGVTYTDRALPALMRCSREDIVRCYSSDDLNTWTDHGSVLVDRLNQYFITPKVIYNRTTKKYVMWYNVLDTLWDGMMNVATSDYPEGPFETQSRDVRLGFEKPGCVALFVDSDDSAYIIYNTHQDHLSQIERLSADYLQGTGEVAPLSPESGEGQILFRRDDLYYYIQGTTCCYRPEGTNALVYTASHPMGPYTLSSEMNPLRAGSDEREVAGQLFGVTEIQTADGPAYIWLATRWHSTPDELNGHDFIYWSPPLQFDAAGKILPMSWTDSFDLELPSSQVVPGANKPQATREQLALSS